MYVARTSPIRTESSDFEQKTDRPPLPPQSFTNQNVRSADWTETVKPFWPAVLRSSFSWRAIKVFLRSRNVRRGALAILVRIYTWCERRMRGLDLCVCVLMKLTRRVSFHPSTVHDAGLQHRAHQVRRHHG